MLQVGVEQSDYSKRDLGYLIFHRTVVHPAVLLAPICTTCMSTCRYTAVQAWPLRSLPFPATAAQLASKQVHGGCKWCRGG